MSTSDSTTIPPFRICSKCKTEYPLTFDYFYHHKPNIHGFNPACKQCINAKVKVWQIANAEKVKGIKRKWALENRETENAKSRDRWHNDPVFREKHTARTLNWDARNSHKIKAAMKKRRNTPEGRLKNRLAQQARRKNTVVTEAQVYEMWDEQEGRCAYCGISIFLDLTRDAAIDHFLAIKNGGGGERENLAVACANCNSQKTDRLYDDWEAVRGW